MNVNRRIDANIEDARAALQTLQDWARTVTPEEVAALDPAIARLLPERDLPNYPDMARQYDADFKPDAAYKATMPDLQNGPSSLIVGAKTRIGHVGISNFRLPIRFRSQDGGTQDLEASITGTVSLEAEQKGINMSRIMRSFYRHAETAFSFEVMEGVLDDYKADLGSLDARLAMSFSYPVKRESLRSGLMGWQYYDLTLEMIEHQEQRLKIVHLDYVYSSTCPCSLELSEHARSQRGRLATPHSQRSVARISVVTQGDDVLWFEDLLNIARKQIVTETQVMVKREDEQAFAELNAANPIFVEDAVRALAKGLQDEPRIGDYRVVASHQESLHSHDAVAILHEGKTFASESLDPGLFASLIHRG
ncbi:GTP cyclohydrolase I FolE2 [Rhodobacteraceae bacterium]|nr:GTP cyclohydrolase I FolE2 [Paracoccaceae bacterium]